MEYGLVAALALDWSAEPVSRMAEVPYVSPNAARVLHYKLVAGNTTIMSKKEDLR